MFEIIIRFEINNDALTIDEIDDRLFEVGFDDAIVSHYEDGKIAIELCRESISHESLVASVAVQVKAAIPSSRVLHR
ncbi:MAG: hypothetical protein HRU18_27435 [Pseudoalteromonas sp.]|uniref:hypothetical protein n=1 Tax=Pseudoalteromonas sp. TaxID=53249 RepID=UPI001D9B27F4|nr:hypothetical protein [Pseudoalteromonas sp.]NRA81946.1 hypothetical protein [Pseudoalteromonas sp.]